ncbi:elongation of very long chain fatty acids protein AAEL008004-like isoform X1 [Uloborus diversus]|uniref:elongation of very long chain fatty acids protein AAEL008004-like isoform X1 n=1 Tax=Uloborus diversus TaxID=327109 RepID=UPI002409FFC7|nr:elongation of very long chain fatty acids protein AAEL008004-like isoform X1 [Uloborus diversus]
MMEAWKHFTFELEPGDPIVQTWPFVRPDYLPFLLTASYLLFIKVLGPQLMKTRQPFGLRHLLIVYNFWIVIMYVGCVATLFYKFCTTDSIYVICKKKQVSDSHHYYTAVSVAWIMYVLKYVEYADTIFFVLRKKFNQITNLHLIHHTLVPVAFWFALRTETCGFHIITGMINSIVHVIMYSYYGLTAIGPEVQKYLWWKKYLTTIQMMQFVIIIFTYIAAYLLNCGTSVTILYFGIFLTSLFLILFGNFYIKTYLKWTAKRPANALHTE